MPNPSLNRDDNDRPPLNALRSLNVNPCLVSSSGLASRLLSILYQLSCAIGALVFMSYQPAFAQTGSDEHAVKAAVERFLMAAGNGDLDARTSMFVASANIGVSRYRNGTLEGSVQPFQDWISAVRARASATRYKEPVDHFTVHVDHGLAFVRADARLLVDGVVRSRNIDYFTLIKQDRTWKFMNASYIALPPGQK